MQKVFADIVLTKSILAQKTGKYRYTGAHSTKKCAVGVDHVVEYRCIYIYIYIMYIAIGVSNTINYIEIN